MAGVTEELANFVSQVVYDNLPTEIVGQAKRLLIEAVANIILGSGSRAGKTLADVLTKGEESSEAILIGIGNKCSLRTAVLYNTAIADCVDSAGGYYKGIVHPGKNVIPTVLTVASTKEKSGKDLILAMMLAIECYFRLDSVICRAHSARGHYDDGTVGTVGSAIAVGKLLGLDKNDLRSAIGNAGMFAPCTVGGNSMDRSLARPLALGLGSANAVLAVTVAQAGVGGPPNILECSGGFYQALSGITELGKVTENLGKVWESLVCYDKPFVGCRLTHSARQGAQSLKREYDIKTDDIDRVIVKLAARSHLVSGHHAKLGANIIEHSASGPYLVANVLEYDDIGPGCLSEERMNDPKVHELADRIDIIIDPELTKHAETDFRAIFSTRMEITLKGGTKYSYSTEYVKGDPFDQWRLTQDELEDKLRVYGSGILSQEELDDITKMISKLEKLDNVAELMDLLAGN